MRSLSYIAAVSASLALVASPSFAQYDPDKEARLARTEPGDGPEEVQAYSPEEATKTMKVPEGFKVQLFASEPMVRQPIGFAIDDRGRVWVAEAYNYPFRDRPPQDRIIILEDTNQDGHADKRTIFYDKLGYVTGVEVGFGGVYVMSPPQMLFIPDRNGDDVPDGEPEVLLDGFGYKESAHNIVSGFNWGPDGWLYGGHGRTTPSDVGPPGTAKEKRLHFDGGVYRYHPTRKVFEGFCDGTTNPWGVGFDDYGQAFVCNCVTPHLYHAIQGAHYEPWRGRPSSQYAFERIETIADHLHYAGTNWKDVADLGLDKHSAAGGGHAHCGTMIYLGNNWPARYRNTVFMGNVHGRRVNNDLLTRRGSGYTASHGQDIMLAEDPWFKAVTVQVGPEGAMYVSDWSDTGECHDYKNTQRATGRIYKLQYGDVKPWKGDISKLKDQQLVNMQKHANDWMVTHARLELQERAAAGNDVSGMHLQLLNGYLLQNETSKRLRYLWALFATGGCDEEWLRGQLNDGDEYVRAWAVRMLSDTPKVGDETITRWAKMAETDPSPFVRLHLASAVTLLPLSQRWPILEKLVQHAEDAGDPNLPLMYWYGLEPLVIENPERAIAFIKTMKLAKLRTFIAQRAMSGDAGYDHQQRYLVLAKMLKGSPKEVQLSILGGIHEAIRGRADLVLPWDGSLAASDDAEVRQLAIKVGAQLGDIGAAKVLEGVVRDTKAEEAEREDALATLIAFRNAKSPDEYKGQRARTAALLINLLDDTVLRPAALRGLANSDRPETAPAILNRYSDMSAKEKQIALDTLAARPSFAESLLTAVEANQIPKADFTAATVRQLQQLKEPEIKKRVAALWSVIGGTSKEIQAQIKQFKTQLAGETLRQADLSRGKEVFTRTCAACHRLFGEGGKIGPDITGSNRSNLDYLLENILDPNALVSKDYQLTVIVTGDGRTLSGLVAEENESVVKLQLQNEQVLVPVEDIETRKLTPVSMMPVGLLRPLSETDVRDLIGYLQGGGVSAGTKNEGAKGPREEK